MGSYIEAAKKQMATVVEQAREKFNVQLRVSFVGYRDYGEIERFAIKDFVGGDDISELQSFIASTPARSHCPDGDIDPAEDVAGGLEKALGMSWSSRNKLLVHIADAPAHGSEYHDFGKSWDNHNGHQDPDPADLMSQLGDKKVAYAFFKITNDTDKMIDKFRDAHKNSRRGFEVHEMGKDASLFASMVLGSIASSVSSAAALLPSSAATPSSSTAY